MPRPTPPSQPFSAYDPDVGSAASRGRTGGVAYWACAIALTVFGFVDLLAIGAPLFVLGVTLLLVGRFRHRPPVFWPVVVGVLVFIAAFILVTPLGCTRTAIPTIDSGVVTVDHTICANVLGIDYSGKGDYEPTMLPAFLAGLAAGAGSATVTRRLLRRSAPGSFAPRASGPTVP